MGLEAGWHERSKRVGWDGGEVIKGVQKGKEEKGMRLMQSVQCVYRCMTREGGRCR